MRARLRYAGAVALLGVGLGHLQQLLVDHYDQIPTIGTLFALNVASATFVGLALLAPVQRLPGRAGSLTPPALAAGGVAIAAGSLIALWVSETSGLFGFQEVGFRSAIAVLVGLEAAAAVLLAGFLATALVGSPPSAHNGGATGQPERHELLDRDAAGVRNHHANAAQ
jgi:hypothetical protein